jgi:glutathione S-transferase
MTKIKLSYFDIEGGRAEPIRLILNWANIEFEDFRFAFSEFAEVRKCTPFGQVPCVEMNGEAITQTNALIRYFGKQAGLYPKDDYQALLCDEVMAVIEDATNKVVATFGLQGEALKAARQALASGALTTYLKWLEARLQKNQGNFYNGEQISIADFKIFVWVRGLCSGHLDHIPTTLVEEVAPSAMKHMKHMSELEKIKTYYNKA